MQSLWAMRPDGSGSVEIYGNDIPFPPSFMFGRQIPGISHGFVFVGTPHFPQGGSFGTMIRIDTRRDIRTRQPMTYLTPHVDIRQELHVHLYAAGALALLAVLLGWGLPRLRAGLDRCDGCDEGIGKLRQLTR